MGSGTQSGGGRNAKPDVTITLGNNAIRSACTITFLRRTCRTGLHGVGGGLYVTWKRAQSRFTIWLEEAFSLISTRPFKGKSEEDLARSIFNATEHIELLYSRELAPIIGISDKFLISLFKLPLNLTHPYLVPIGRLGESHYRKVPQLRHGPWSGKSHGRKRRVGVGIFERLISPEVVELVIGKNEPQTETSGATLDDSPQQQYEAPVDIARPESSREYLGEAEGATAAVEETTGVDEPPTFGLNLPIEQVEMQQMSKSWDVKMIKKREKRSEKDTIRPLVENVVSTRRKWWYAMEKCWMRWEEGSENDFT
ncbi:hypothetical protein CPB86DRAFT_802554 [Serendipita vermifera]|nr:hypothetical protein CPB86DRAFT_802554 [Serendipita vermifera]